LKPVLVAGKAGFRGGKLIMQKGIRSDLERSRLSQAIGLVFDFDERWLEFFYSHKGGELRCEPADLLAEVGCFSRGEQVMIKVALDLWTDGNRASVSEIVGNLDWTNLNRVLLAIMTMRDVTIEDLADASSQYES
jgi:hypothetical protein